MAASFKPKAVLKRVLPGSWIASLRQRAQRASLGSSRWFARSRSLSHLYYAFSGAFRRETHGVLYGRWKYLQDVRSPGQSQFLLRRNVHRLEKGLVSRPRRAVFATGYIGETVTAFGRALAASPDGITPASELRWAHDVLRAYFDVNASDPRVDAARREFERVMAGLGEEDRGESLTPYARRLEGEAPVGYEALKELAVRRRSVRWYDQKPVPRELIDKAIDIAALSPSACNRQPFEFRVFDDPALVQKVASIPGGTRGFNQNFPVIVVVVGRLRAYFAERDRHLIYIDGSLAAMAFMFALETVGLSSCGINWPDVPEKERAMAKALSLEPDERPVMLISLGYPDPTGMVPYSQKKPLDQLRSYNRTT